jgi:hypothetical protein
MLGMSVIRGPKPIGEAAGLPLRPPVVKPTGNSPTRELGARCDLAPKILWKAVKRRFARSRPPKQDKHVDNEKRQVTL